MIPCNCRYLRTGKKMRDIGRGKGGGAGKGGGKGDRSVRKSIISPLSNQEIYRIWAEQVEK